MSEYTPLTERVRISYADFIPEMEAEFDRWLVAHDATVRVEALREAARVVRAYPSSHSAHVSGVLEERAKGIA